MIVIAGLLLGALWGVRQAKRRKGTRLDLIHYATAHAMVFALVGLFVTIVIERLL